MLDVNALPDDVEGLKRLLLHTVQAKDQQLQEKQHQIEHLKFQLAKLRRERYGQTSEKLQEAGQIPLTFEELRAALTEAARQTPAAPEAAAPEKGKPVRRKRLPEHFERDDKVIEPGHCVCPDCGGTLSLLGKADASEVLEVKTVTFKAPVSQ